MAFDQTFTVMPSVQWCGLATVLSTANSATVLDGTAFVIPRAPFQWTQYGSLD